MRKAFLFILLGIVAFSCVKDPDGGTAQPGVKVRLITPEYSTISTKAPFDDSAIIDVWVLQYVNGTLIGKTFFPESTSWLSGFDVPAYPMSAGPGNVMYFFANTTVNGTDPISDDTDFAVGTSTLADLNAYHFPVSEASFGSYIPMRGEYGSAIGANASIAVPMTRMAVKISFNFDATSLNQFIASSIQLCRVPGVTALPANANQPPLPVGGETAGDPPGFTAYPAGDVFSDYAEQPIGINLTGEGRFTWYMAENVRGSFLNVASNRDKYPASPSIGENAENQTKYTYIFLKGTCIDNNGKLLDVSYKIYLGGNATGDMNLIANTEYEITTTITGTNSADTRITATGIDITGAPATSNCYIVNATGEGQVIFIPVLQAVKGIARVRDFNTSIPLFDPLTTAWSADVLWQTWQATLQANNQLGVSRVKGTDEQQYIRVVLPPGVQNGNNAVIAIRDAGGILWSWHLWITDYNPYSAIPVNGELHTYSGGAFQSGGWANTQKIMDRNLGAMWTGGTPRPADVIDDPAKAGRTYGLLYQWGRKDPFPGASGTSVTEAIPIYGGDLNSPALAEGSQSTGLGAGINRVPAPIGNNLANAVRNPMTFYSSTMGDWYINTSSGHNDDLWAQPFGTQKSVFDPCPLGYRVPPSGNTAILNPWVSFAHQLNPLNASNISAHNSLSDNFVWYANGASQGSGADGNTITPTAGRLYVVDNVNAWYPATGYRAAKNGEFMNNTDNTIIVGGFIDCWSAVGNGPNSVTAGYLASDQFGVRPNGASHRAFGFGVRCVQE